ncbi:Pro-sigma-E processing factor spoIIR [Desulforamulus hydrothermalis Lam5 = DSM 18033]|uniref:Pro-sigma-E processing factor spoIIR n=1 Tax=Desulforamulus hydrothermalis Lam5 = DSM 18033 TaxID=1121428 RepID=K8EHU4_9FIRM|nr:stage II sporulation protein R [Desulforamulus hydrothermalis]CCO08206.1 Pro-sigma-E processing factor spoIIR [Desulforamulus hydrothermalis Lam5 = DSM 18033]SHH22468.1 stage II sporulation protein R [Desulforamulus hydrothermalis Lam5 = DSM 18033]
MFKGIYKNYHLACLILVCISFAFISYRIYIQQEFAGQLIRFHVIANSNSWEDQKLKLMVRDVIVNEMKDRFRSASTRQEAEQIVQDNIREIKELAQRQVNSVGKDYPVEVMVGDFAFPTKSYGNLTLPAGNYHAVRIIIGEGKGENWWCVLFPPLCFADSVETLPEDVKGKGLKVFEKDQVEFRLKCTDFLNIFS